MHHLAFSKVAEEKDPYSNYHCGVIVIPTEVRRRPDGEVLVKIDGKWANCHAPNNVNLFAYGIRWWLLDDELETYYLFNDL